MEFYIGAFDLSEYASVRNYSQTRELLEKPRIEADFIFTELPKELNRNLGIYIECVSSRLPLYAHDPKYKILVTGFYSIATAETYGLGDIWVSMGLLDKERNRVNLLRYPYGEGWNLRTEGKRRD